VFNLAGRAHLINALFQACDTTCSSAPLLHSHGRGAALLVTHAMIFAMLRRAGAEEDARGREAGDSATMPIRVPRRGSESSMSAC